MQGKQRCVRSGCQWTHVLGRNACVHSKQWIRERMCIFSAQRIRKRPPPLSFVWLVEIVVEVTIVHVDFEDVVLFFVGWAQVDVVEFR